MRGELGARRRSMPALHVGRGLLTANALMLFAFLYVPVVVLVIFSFNSTRSVAVLAGFSTQWYAALVENAELIASAKNSLRVGLIATIVSTGLGSMTALSMDRFRFRLRTAFDANLYLPIVIPEIVMGISLLLFFNQALFPFLQSALGVRATTGLPTVTIAHIAFDIPFVYVIVRARLADFDRSLEEAAQDLGANEWRTFQRVTLPLIMPGIVGGALLAFTLSLDDYLITAFTRGVRDQTMPIYIYSLVRRGVTPEINALSTLLLCGSIGLVGLSLLSQGGGALYPRAMAVGAGLGALAYGLILMISGAVTGSLFAGTDLRQMLLIPAGLSLVWVALKVYREELVGAEKSPRRISFLIIVTVVIAVYVSMLLLLN